ncbi:hypothetical protein HMPREF0281_01063 [Corynebacterium ammoniagenes DSM 20306]|jgi:hypothetical protein|uniref:Uncharacterized protein n=1 Tax=Corynebacterium ammoniagenes DSM 20306 TaxID=649754 RepID=A0ABP2IKG5_CORAM|nr:hypothetical protein HMPREF0281_01063 [Corynebacterium ammoniagenes DSM 20306]
MARTSLSVRTAIGGLVTADQALARVGTTINELAGLFVAVTPSLSKVWVAAFCYY